MMGGRNRKRYMANRFQNGSRQSIGDHYVTQACDALNIACLKEAAMFVPAMDVSEVVPMLFRDEDVAKLKAVHKLLSTEETMESYDLKPYAQPQITLVTTDLRMPAPAKGRLHWQYDRTEKLYGACLKLHELQIKWGAVKHLLRWFNKNATPGAVRANWPSVLTLCKDAPMLSGLQHAPTRYTNPQELSALLPLIRATATTVASMQMLPADVSPRMRKSVIITMPQSSVDYEGTKISLDTQTFYL